jgi:hypothetical protein
MGYYQVKVKFTLYEGKKSNVNYLVEAESVTEAEANTTKYLTERDEANFEITSASTSNIAEVIISLEGQN